MYWKNHIGTGLAMNFITNAVVAIVAVVSLKLSGNALSFPKTQSVRNSIYNLYEGNGNKPIYSLRTMTLRHRETT